MSNQQGSNPNRSMNVNIPHMVFRDSWDALAATAASWSPLSSSTEIAMYETSTIFAAIIAVMAAYVEFPEPDKAWCQRGSGDSQDERKTDHSRGN